MKKNDLYSTLASLVYWGLFATFALIFSVQFMAKSNAFNQKIRQIPAVKRTLAAVGVKEEANIKWREIDLQIKNLVLKAQAAEHFRMKMMGDN